MKTGKQVGFTIIELMISTAVFSTILLVILTAVTTIGRMYYKGITTSQTQEVTRSILDQVSQEIQFTGQGNVPVVGTSGAVNLLCVGSTRYYYIINKLSSSSSRVLWTDTIPGCVTTANAVSEAGAINMNQAKPTPNGSELIPDGMRLVAFNATQAVAGNDTLWTVRVKVVFGADDLIDATNPATGVVVSQATNPAWTTCKGSTIGTQFCAISDLSTTVFKRVP